MPDFQIITENSISGPFFVHFINLWGQEKFSKKPNWISDTMLKFRKNWWFNSNKAFSRWIHGGMNRLIEELKDRCTNSVSYDPFGYRGRSWSGKFMRRKNLITAKHFYKETFFFFLKTWTPFLFYHLLSLKCFTLKYYSKFQTLKFKAWEILTKIPSILLKGRQNCLNQTSNDTKKFKVWGSVYHIVHTKLQKLFFNKS